MDIPDENVPLKDVPTFEEIEDEGVPLADIPQTGDSGHLLMWLILTAASGCGMILLLPGRKKEETHRSI